MSGITLFRMAHTAALALVLSGCVLYTKAPLTTLDESPGDSALSGTWYAEEEGERTYLHLGTIGDSKQLRAVMVTADADGSLDVTTLTGHVSVMDGNRYLNIRFDEKEDRALGYMLIKYRVEHGSLAMSLWSLGPARGAIDRGELEGRNIGEGMFSPLQVTGEPERLRRFVRDHDQELFKDFVELQRLPMSEGGAEEAARPLL